MTEETAVKLLPLDLEHLSKGALRILAGDPRVDPELLARILEQERDDEETLRCLIRNPALPDSAFEPFLDSLSEELRREVRDRGKALAVVPERVPARPGGAESREEGREGRRESVQQRIQRMEPAEKIALALKGPKEARGILIRDPNKEIALTVLKNPKITESEIEYYAGSTNLVEDVHREIAKNREWCRKYSVLRALVFNPKTPVGVSTDKLPYVRDRDLQFLAKSKNVPSAVAAGAKRLLAKRAKKKG